MSWRDGDLMPERELDEPDRDEFEEDPEDPLQEVEEEADSD